MNYFENTEGVGVLATADAEGRRKYPDDKHEPLFLAFFCIDKILPLIGPGEDD